MTVTDTPRWGGDELPPGLTEDDRIGWEVVSTVVVRLVPDPITGWGQGLSVEYHGTLPKMILAHQMLNFVSELMTHSDFQHGAPLQDMSGDEEEGT